VLPRNRRIRRGVEFRSVLRSGCRASSRTVVVHVGRMDGIDTRSGSDAGPRSCARVGFVVGRSVGGAVERNRVARRLRHLMAARIGSIPDDLAVVIRALPPAAAATPRDLDRDLSRALDRCLARVSRPVVGQGNGTPPQGTQ
jgi:ribonuclease P protein component